jgi:hypothetical protein
MQEGQQLLADRVSADATRHAEQQDDLHGVHHPAADPKLHKYSAGRGLAVTALAI